MRSADTHEIRNGDRILPEEIPGALTAAAFIYADGATQVFTADGHTTYREHGSPAEGDWGVDPDGRFWSFWPPSYRGVYDLTWIVEATGESVGVRFSDVRYGGVSEGRYVAADAV